MNPGVHLITIRKVRKTAAGEASGRCTSLTIILIVRLIASIPCEWNYSRLGYESYIRARLGWKGLKADEYVDEGYAFISAFNIQSGQLVWEPLNFITEERYDESPEIKLQIGDVIIVIKCKYLV